MDPITIGLIGAAIGGLGSLLGSADYEESARLAQENIDRAIAAGRKEYQPYINRGNLAQNEASQLYSRMMSDPSAFINTLMSQYNQTPGYDFRRERALKDMRNTAAAGGFSGTTFDQLQQAEMADGLLSQDMQQYLENVLGLQGQGLTGQQHVADMGYNASGALASHLGNAYMGNATLNESQGRQRMANTQGLFNSIAGGFGLGMDIGGRMQGGTGNQANLPMYNFGQPLSIPGLDFSTTSRQQPSYSGARPYGYNFGQPFSNPETGSYFAPRRQQPLNAFSNTWNPRRF